MDNNNMIIDPEYILNLIQCDALHKIRKYKKVSKNDMFIFTILYDRLNELKKNSNYFEIVDKYKQNQQIQQEDTRNSLIYLIIDGYVPLFNLNYNVRKIIIKYNLKINIETLEIIPSNDDFYLKNPDLTPDKFQY